MVSKTDLKVVQWLLEEAYSIQSVDIIHGERVLLIRLLVARTKEFFDGLTTKSLSIASTQHQNSVWRHAAA